MSIAELVYEQVKALPEPLAREVLDFIGFLRERGERQTEWFTLEEAAELVGEAGMIAILRDLARTPPPPAD